MKTVFISSLKPLMDAIAERIALYVPRRTGEHYVFEVYTKGDEKVEFNSIRTCTPVKSFLFPIREVAATYPEPTKPEDIRPFALFGLKDCDLKSIAILDKVFAEDEYVDPLYVARREKMFIISSDCTDPADSCFCCLFDGRGFSSGGFDLNVSQIKNGFIIESGSNKGRVFLEEHSQLFADVPTILLNELQEKRLMVQKLLNEKNSNYKWQKEISQVVKDSEESEVYDDQAQNCIECQACTRVCPTCHCFYLYDGKQSDYFTKMKIWDSCMRFSYAAVAGGTNPNKILGDRMKHRLMHKFVHFMERYGVNMCVGCGRCIDADAGGMDLREILTMLSEQPNDKKETKAAK
ncbi:MAG: hypothetical protein E4H40_00805 [Candidatus Brocadiia bacterium]|nr:MAG: hypothetical protein E4H40_00805 [Candidatus Brocadiia bacterium]